MKIRTLTNHVLFSLIRVGLGISWLHEGIFKVQAHFTMSGLTQAVTSNTVTPDWYKVFMVHFVEPNTALFNLLIPWGEILAGAGLITGILTLPALSGAIFMNINYWLANMIYIYPLQLLVAVILLIAIRQASHFSLANLYFYLKDRMRRKSESNPSV
ncbi:DoxX family membrane protein [Sporolactobacillus shoreae]|uniref:DoxX family membrane protein n=1 Tax=Sporolactobacillus shoreae TaxID=1465501 RepID=A0A4Z0GQV5_9BACL|nr:DoxX family membrane protein [Sporolactobacillus shoreae]TGA98917.1 DoxX family membrane protein [Sporolactobacillus shoreae]